MHFLGTERVNDALSRQQHLQLGGLMLAVVPLVLCSMASRRRACGMSAAAGKRLVMHNAGGVRCCCMPLRS
jgi:hypothetical protein